MRPAGFALLLAGFISAGVDATCQCLIAVRGAVRKAWFNLRTNGKMAHLAWEVMRTERA